MRYLHDLGLTAEHAFAAARALAILLAAVVAHMAAARAMDRVRRAMLAAMRRRARARNGELEKRAGTLAGVLRKAAAAAIWLLAGLSIPKQFGFDLTPVLAGLSVGALAVGLGARTFIEDVISGAILLLENQIRVGDVCEVNGQRGAVAEVNLRTTVLRSGDGTVHVFPNGSIRRLANVTRGYSCFVLDLPVSRREDPDRAMALVCEEAAKLAGDPQFAPLILEPLEMLGVDQFTASAMIVRARLKTQPGQQVRVGRELNRRLKRRFDELGIRFPLPSRTLYFGEAADPLRAVRTQPNGRATGPTIGK